MASTKLTIGTDPELVLSYKGKLVRAGDVIMDRGAKFGLDGHPYIAELRPDAAVHPKDLVESVKKTLGSRAEELAKYSWLAGPWALDKPLGGHIHFGVRLEERFKEALNHQFAPILALIEPPEGAAQRRTFPFYNGHAYGLLGDIREKRWGFEYRTPGSFIVSPGISLGVMALAKAIIWEEMNKGKSAWSSLNDAQRKELTFAAKDFHECKRDVFKPMLPKIEEYLRDMVYFKEGQEGRDLWPSITYLINQVIKKGGYNAAKDIKGRWKLLEPAVTDEPSIAPPKIVPAQDWWRRADQLIGNRADQFRVVDPNGNPVNIVHRRIRDLVDAPGGLTPDVAWRLIA